MRIEEASRATGLSRDMIRHYEKLGLLRPGRLENRYRDYSDDDLYVLVTIKYLSNLGVPLKAIKAAFATGHTDSMIGSLHTEIDKLMTEKKQIDARIAAARDSVACFEMLEGDAPWLLYTARERYLLSYREWKPDEAQAAAREHCGFFQFYYRRGYACAETFKPSGEPDRGLLLYDSLPGAERIPAQQCLRTVIQHESGRILNETDLDGILREAMRMTGLEEFTVLIHQFFQQRGEPAVCAEVLLG